jgi:hypothetical protein
MTIGTIKKRSMSAALAMLFVALVALGPAVDSASAMYPECNIYSHKCSAE